MSSASEMPDAGRSLSARWSSKILAGVIATQAIVLLWISWATAPGFDEWGLLPSGLYHLQYGRYEPYSVNPPLIRILAAVPVLAMGGAVDQMDYSDWPGIRPEWNLLPRYAEKHKADCFRLFSIARTAVLPFPLLGTYLIWMLMRRWSCDFNACIAAILWAFSPTVLTFGACIAADVPTAVIGLLATILFWKWINHPSWRNWIVWTVMLGFAMLCKTSWIILPPLLAATWLATRLAERQRRLGLQSVQIALGTAIVLFMMNAAYEFRGTLRSLGSFNFVSVALREAPLSEGTLVDIGGNRFRHTWLEELPVPFPKDFVLGIDIQKQDFESRRESYLFGEWSKNGWWYYYIAALLVKEPFALWLLFGMAVISAARKGWRGLTAEQIAIALPGIAIFLFVSSQTGINRHLRYVLPVFPILFWIAASGKIKGSIAVRRLKLLLTAWFVLSSVSVLPRSNAYFSEVVGGPYQGWRYLCGSNLDWGQDLMTLQDWLRDNPSAEPRYLLYSITGLHPDVLGLPVLRGEEFLTQGNGNRTRFPTKSGTWIVFAKSLIGPEGRWFQGRTPSVILSPTIRIYELSKSDLVQLQE